MKRLTAILVLLLSAAPQVHASDYGCTVLLCLADPRGPKTESACVAPIEQLMWDLAHGRGFPSCAMVSGGSGSSRAVQGYSYYDACPPGTRELAAQTEATTKSRSAIFQGIGAGDGVAPTSGDNIMPNKICVGNAIGSAEMGTGDDRRTVTVYDRLVTMPPVVNPRFVDIYVDNAFLRRVRW